MKEIPFRWNLARRNQLGKLVEGERVQLYPGFYDELLTCCSRILAFSGNSNLVFVGRSPESIFDHLSGLLFDSTWCERLELLHFSMRFQPENKIKAEYPAAIEAMRSYLEHLGLHPETIATRKLPVAFIDLVYTGDTFGRLINFFFNWSKELKFDWSAVKRRIRITGITERTKTSPKTWRWQQHSEWIPLLGAQAVKNVSISRALWGYLGDYQPKVTLSYNPSRWGDPALASPTYYPDQLKALRLAFELFELGRTKEKREEFASLLATESAIKESWFRKLIGELRA